MSRGTQSSLATEELGHSREAAAEDDQHVVMVDADAAGQLPGAAGRPLGRIVHGQMVEGAPAQAA